MLFYLWTVTLTCGDQNPLKVILCVFFFIWIIYFSRHFLKKISIYGTTTFGDLKEVKVLIPDSRDMENNQSEHSKKLKKMYK